MVPHQHRTVKLFCRKTGIVASLIFSCLKPWTQKGFGVPNLKKQHWINTAYMYVFQNVWVVNHKCSNLQLEKIIFEDFMIPSAVLCFASAVLNIPRGSIVGPWVMDVNLHVTKMFVVICSVYLKFLQVVLWINVIHTILHIFRYALLNLPYGMLLPYG